MLWVGEVHLSEIISSVELYFNIGRRVSEWEKYTSVSLNIGGGLFSEWEKYISVKLYLTSVKLYLVSSYTVLI